MPRTLFNFWVEGTTIQWECPRCHNTNHIRIIEENDFFGDKCDCEQIDTVYAQRTMQLNGREIKYLVAHSEVEYARG